MLRKDVIGEESGDEPGFYAPDGRFVTRRFRILSHDEGTQVTQREFIYHVNHPNGLNERYVHAFGFKRTLRDEAEELLVESGFEIEEMYSDFMDTPYRSTCSELVILARRR